VSDELVIFARFHAIAGNESAVANELRETAICTRAEPGCLFIEVYRSTRDPGLFVLNSRWRDEAAFDGHAALVERI
jgi:quinol monooxygenase YgiN